MSIKEWKDKVLEVKSYITEELEEFELPSAIDVTRITNAIKKHKLSVDDVVNAIQNFAEDRDFHNSLDNMYGKEVEILDELD
jgi:hypothetical protein